MCLCRPSPWPGVSQIQRELLGNSSSEELASPQYLSPEDQGGHLTDQNAALAAAAGGDGSGAGDIAEQLAQLQEESWRLQQQSKALQQRAMEMSFQVSVGGPGAPAVGDIYHSSISPSLAAHHQQQQQQQQALPQSLTSDALSQLMTQGLVNSDPLGQLMGQMGPGHLPGEATPSSVTSSRAGLNWNLPGRDSRLTSPAPYKPYSPTSGSYLGSPDVTR
jgi:hypothetical protein